ncbi:MAG TPA: DUF4249 family protein, partial [Chryseolinea sp.]|nr:DUF4249 family protein [Chryseolinea sp.]
MLSRIVWLILIVLFAGCLDPYAPPTGAADVVILVVDGSLDTSEGSATVALSRGATLSMPDSFPTVGNAFVAVEDALGNIYPLTEESAGNYQATGIPIYSDAQYRLHIITQENEEYYSDAVAPRAT